MYGVILSIDRPDGMLSVSIYTYRYLGSSWVITTLCVSTKALTEAITGRVITGESVASGLIKSISVPTISVSDMLPLHKDSEGNIIFSNPLFSDKAVSCGQLAAQPIGVTKNCTIWLKYSSLRSILLPDARACLVANAKSFGNL